MKVTMLGTGTSTGIPVIACDCFVCQSDDPKNNRTRASIFVEHEGKSFLIDVSTDFRQQALREKIKKIDSVLLTHAHADHIHGIDDLRSFNLVQKGEIPIYMDDDTYLRVKKYFDYIFCSECHGKSFIPRLLREPLEDHNQIQGLQVESFPLDHGYSITRGIRIGKMAYCTDVKRIPEPSMQRLEGLDLLILDALRYRDHATHMTIEEALEIVKILKPKQCYFTHMTHDIDHETVNSELPEGIQLAYDGLVIEI